MGYEQRPAKEWQAPEPSRAPGGNLASLEWADGTFVYTKDVFVEESQQEPRLVNTALAAAI